MKYAAIVSRSITIPGDERSRTNPGHGYGEYIETYSDFKEFKDIEDMKSWVKTVTTGYLKPQFRLIQYEELKYDTSVSVAIKVGV